MALGEKSIAELDHYMDYADNYLKRFHEKIEESIEQLTSNSNYQTFVENTEIGNELNSKILKLKEIGINTGDDVNKLLKTTRDFNERQRTLNSFSAKGGYAEPGGVGSGNGAVSEIYGSDPRFYASGIGALGGGIGDGN